VNGVIRANFTEIQGGTIFISGAACVNCARMIAASGIATVVHRVDASMAHRNPRAVEKYLERMGVEVRRYER
jgi:deoxycytidylate deaminase